MEKFPMLDITGTNEMTWYLHNPTPVSIDDTLVDHINSGAAIPVIKKREQKG